MKCSSLHWSFPLSFLFVFIQWSISVTFKAFYFWCHRRGEHKFERLKWENLGEGEEEKGFLYELSLIYSIVGKRYKIKAKLSNGDYYFYILINKHLVLPKSTERKFVGLTQFYFKKITENIKIWPHSLEYDSLQWYHCLFEHTVGARICNILLWDHSVWSSHVQKDAA